MEVQKAGNEMGSQEQYERALKRAKDEGIVICGDSVAPDGRRAWSVYNPANGADGWYTVRQVAGQTHYTCNCRATVLCKHVALVMSDQAERAARKAKDAGRWTVDNLAVARRDPFAQISMWA